MQYINEDVRMWRQRNCHCSGRYRILCGGPRRKKGSLEWRHYVSTGTTGRVDTAEVRSCIEDMLNWLLNTAGLEPTDPRRMFSPSQRAKIFSESNSRCAACGTQVSPSNFHADHKIPHSAGGMTDPTNGQVLCSGCNVRKGSGLSRQLPDSK
ncbi:MAG: HNH endonuclease [Betaproteobacteria bacterium]|nr:HNH endonuclease [Betaproteobacteria bacterium]